MKGDNQMHRFVHNVAERFFDDLVMDVMPSSMAVFIDFFPAPPLNEATMKAYYNAYHRGVRSGSITAAELDEAVGCGEKLSVLIHRIDGTLPFIKTCYDCMS